ncbi:MAG: sugar phosphate nucleotidyltransferase, partial [Armatimonadota bacterium]
GRLRRVRDYVGTDTFCFTYGDGVGDVNITELVAFHKAQGTDATLTAVQPAGRFGALGLVGGQNRITSFQEKPDGDGAWVNGGFFVLEPSVIDLIEEDSTVWETGPLRDLASSGRLSAYRHDGFWQPMDTLADKQKLDKLWASGNAPWKVW